MLISGCVKVGPDYQTPGLDLPTRWSDGPSASTTVDDVALHRWWTLFRDPMLDALLAQALTANPDLNIAETRIREARAQRQLVGAAGLPSVDIGAGFSNSRSERSSSEARTRDLYQAHFDAGWEIDLFGGVRRRVEAAEANLIAKVEDRRDVLVSLTAEVARNYLEVRSSQYRLAIAGENSRSQEQTVELVRGKLQIGLGSDLEVAQAETLLAQTQAQIPALESSMLQAGHQLALLIGQQPQALQSQLATPGPFLPVPPQLPVILPSDLLRQRPDIRSAERQLAAATAVEGASMADLFPRFSLSALVGVQSGSLSDLVASGNRFWTVGPTVRWPLFDGGRTEAAVEISRAQRERARVAYEKTVLTALAETENSLVALDRERAVQQALTTAVTTSQRAVAIAQGQYKAGITPFLNVLQSENALYQTQDKLAQSTQRLALAMIALYKALGGGWQDQDTSSSTSTTGNRQTITPPKMIP